MLRLLAASLPLVLVASASAQVLAPPFDQTYSVLNLGSIPGVPTNYGGLTVKFDDPNTLLIGGGANGAAGAIYAIQVARDVDGHITSFVGEPQVAIEAAYNDGGVSYGPGNVLFLARWPVNQLGQARPGSTITDRIDDVAVLGVEGSLASVNFVPVGFPGAGRMKLCSWSGGQWSDASVSPDGNGTYNISPITVIPASRLAGGPEGFTYAPINSPGFPTPSMLVSEYSAGTVGAFELDENGDPIVASRRDFITGLFGAEGANIDPVTGDFLFSTFGGGNQVIVVSGFSRPCRPDFNGDGTLDADDLGDYINCYFSVPACDRADFNNDLNTDPDDLGDFINAYFAGCV
ncbi:MAG: hypothetical protein AB7K52_00275 [Phycisphaerales bacterium]